MDAILRGATVYIILYVLMTVSGKRTFAETTPFDFVLILIIAETTQQALLGNDFSITNSFLLIVTLLFIDITLSIIKSNSKKAGKLLEGTLVIVLKNGELIKDIAKKVRIDEGDVMQAARKFHGLERIDEVKYAIMESDGKITVIPKKNVN